MVTLIAVLVTTFFASLLNDGHATGTMRILLPLMASACIPWAAWLDLSGYTETGAKTPFISALLFAVAGPVYLGLLPANVADVIALGNGVVGPLRFAAEFTLMLFAPLALLAAPVVRLFVPLKWSNYNASGFPATRMYQALAVLMLGLMSLVYVLSAALNVEGLFDNLGSTTGAGIWRQTAPIMVPMWMVGTIFSTFALAWGQLAEGLPSLEEKK